jgi:hypothetical protein
LLCALLSLRHVLAGSRVHACINLSVFSPSLVPPSSFSALFLRSLSICAERADEKERASEQARERERGEKVGDWDACTSINLAMA